MALFCRIRRLRRYGLFSQYDLYVKKRVTLENNLVFLTGKVFPGVNEMFKSPERADGRRKWVGFVTAFWHCECISHVSEEVLPSATKSGSGGRVISSPLLKPRSHRHVAKNDNTKLLIQTAAKEFTSTSELMALVKVQMIAPVKQLPEYDTVMTMYGVGEDTGPQLLAEIVDMRNYPRRDSIVAFAGINPEADPSSSSHSQPMSTFAHRLNCYTLFRLLFLHFGSCFLVACS